MNNNLKRVYNRRNICVYVCIHMYVGMYIQDRGQPHLSFFGSFSYCLMTQSLIDHHITLLRDCQMPPRIILFLPSQWRNYKFASTCVVLFYTDAGDQIWVLILVNHVLYPLRYLGAEGDTDFIVQKAINWILVALQSVCIC